MGREKERVCVCAVREEGFSFFFVFATFPI